MNPGKNHRKKTNLKQKCLLHKSLTSHLNSKHIFLQNLTLVLNLN